MNIFEFNDYRVYLRQTIQKQPRKGRGLIKSLAEFIKIDPSQVSQILTGTKDFTEEQAMLAIEYFTLNELEAEFFLTLVKIERAGSVRLREHYIQKKNILRAQSMDLQHRLDQNRILSDSNKSIFYSSYLYSGIRLSTSIGSGQTLAEVCERFEIPRKKTKQILDFLVQTQLCNEKDGVYTMGTQHTHIDRNSPLLGNHHRNWRIKALENIDSTSEEELQFTGPVSLGKEDFQYVRERLVEMIQLAVERAKSSTPTEVACLLIDWFKVRK